MTKKITSSLGLNELLLQSCPTAFSIIGGEIPSLNPPARQAAEDLAAAVAEALVSGAEKGEVLAQAGGFVGSEFDYNSASLLQTRQITLNVQ